MDFMTRFESNKNILSISKLHLMFSCSRCSETFDKVQYFNRHLNKKHPCDNVCRECGLKTGSKTSYLRHTKEGDCKPVPKTENNVVIKKEQTVNVIGNNNNTLVADTINNNSMNLAMNVKFDTPNKSMLALKGMTPHGFEIEDLYRIHKDTLIEMTRKFLIQNTRDDRITDAMLETLVIAMIQLFYTNEQYPEHMNIMDNEPGCGVNKVYSGQHFVEDVMSKNTRNRYILQILMSILKRIQQETIIQIRTFISGRLISHIVHYYFDDKYHDQLQNVWSKNCELLKNIELEEVPIYRDDRFRDYNYNTELEKQIGLYKEEALKLNILAIENEVESCLAKLDKKKVLDLTDANPAVRTVNSQEDQAETTLQIEAAPLTEEQIVAQTVEQKKQEKIEAIKRSAGMSQKRDLSC